MLPFILDKTQDTPEITLDKLGNRFDFNGNLSNYLYEVLPPLFKDDLDENAYKEFSENLYYSQYIKEKNLRIISFNSLSDD